MEILRENFHTLCIHVCKLFHVGKCYSTLWGDSINKHVYFISKYRKLSDTKQEIQFLNSEQADIIGYSMYTL